MRWSLGAACLIAGVLVLGRFDAGDFLNFGILLTVLWNLLPVILAGLLVWRGPWGTAGPVMRGALVGFVVGAAGCSIWMSGDWWWTLHSGGRVSSTAGLAFLIYPVVEIFGAAVTMGVFALVAALTRHRGSRSAA